MSSNLYQIEKLGKENYEGWKLQMKMILIHTELWEYVNGSIPNPGHNIVRKKLSWREYLKKKKSSECTFDGSEVVGEVCFDDGERVRLPNSSTRYLECERGRFVVKKCVQGNIFDSVEKQCVTPSLSNVGCDHHYTINDKKHVKGNQKEYVYCENGLLKVGTCQGYFNRFSKKCEQNNAINLKNILEHNNQWFLNSQEKCKPGNKKPVVNSCSKYMECDSNEVWVPAVCPDCQHFQPESMGCVWAWKYYCGSSVTTENPTSTSTEEPTSSSTPTEEPSSSSTPTEEPTSSSTPTEEPTSSSTPTEEPTSSSTPTEEPTSSSTPTEEPTSSSTPTEEPTSSSTPTEEPTSSSTPTEEPTSSSTPTEEPTSETTPTEGPITPSEPTSTTTNATSTTIRSTTTTTTTTTTTSTTPTPQCTTIGQKKIFEKGDCKDYLECDSGKWVKKSCSFGYDFDINKLDCVWSWWAKC